MLDPHPHPHFRGGVASLEVKIGSFQGGVADFDLQDGQFLPHPSLLHPYLDQNTSAYLREALQWDFQSPLQIPKQGRKDLMEGLTRYMNIHLDGFGRFRSLEVLTELFT